MIYRFRHPDLHQEEDDLPWGTIVLVFLGTFLVAGALVAWAGVTVASRERQLRPSGEFPEQDLGKRRSVAAIHEDLFEDEGQGQVLNEEKARELSRWHWVDREHGIVAIPIDDAMDLVVRENQR